MPNTDRDCICIGSFDWPGWHEQYLRVYSQLGVAPAVVTLSGGGRDTKVMEVYEMSDTEPIMETCEECKHYDAMNGTCPFATDDDEELCPMARGELCE